MGERAVQRSDGGNGLVVVRAEPCARFEEDADAPAGACLACGWLAEDHEAATGSRAVTVLHPVRGRGQERRAS